MMAQAIIGSPRIEVAGTQAALLGGSAEASGLDADFGVLFQQSTDAAPSGATPSLTKPANGLPTLADALKVPGGWSTEVVPGSKSAVGVVRALPHAKDAAVGTTPQLESGLTTPLENSLGSKERLKTDPEHDLQLPKQLNDPSFTATAALPVVKGRVLDPVSGPKSLPVAMIPNPAAKPLTKDGKTSAKQVAPVVTEQAIPLVIDGGTLLTVPKGVLPATVPARHEGAIASAEEKPSSNVPPSLHRVLVGGSALMIPRNEAALKPERAASDATVNALAPANSSGKETSASVTMLPASGIVHAEGEPSGSGALTVPLPLEARFSQALEKPGIGALTSQHESSSAVSIAATTQEGGLPHTRLTATPTTLEVGVNGGAHGWLKIRAELTRTGEVTASLGGVSPSAASVLRRELPALSSYLLAEKIQVGTLSVHTMLPSASELSSSTEEWQHGGSSDLSGGLAGDSAHGGTPYDEGRQAAASLNQATDADDPTLASRTMMNPYGGGSGLGSDSTLSPLEYGADGSWLNVRV